MKEETIDYGIESPTKEGLKVSVMYRDIQKHSKDL